MQRLKEVFYIGSLLGNFFPRVSVFQGFHNNEQVQMRSTIAANISKQFFKNLEFLALCSGESRKKPEGGPKTYKLG